MPCGLARGTLERATEPNSLGHQPVAAYPMLDGSSVGIHLVDIDTGDPVSSESSLNRLRKFTWANT